MEGAFDFNTRMFLSLNSQLPYGDKSPQMDFFDAAFKGDLRRVREMASGKDAEAKARLADVSVGGLGPLQAAARLGRLDVVKCVVKELGFDINVGSSETGVTALHGAALDGKLDTVMYLLDNGADPNKIDEPGEVPLHCAAKYGHDEVARLLLSRGASVDVAYFHGTPLHIAAVYGKANVMKVLLEHHADVEKYGRSTKLKLKLDGDKAVGRKDYLAASKLYTEAVELDPNDSALYSSRSLCYLQIGEANKALLDANTCIAMRPEWLKGYYRKGVALMSLKEYKEACDVFLVGLKLEPANVEMERMFRIMSIRGTSNQSIRNWHGACKLRGLLCCHFVCVGIGADVN